MPRPVDVSHPDFQARLARLCSERGFDASSLSRASGVSQKVVSGLLRGKRSTAAERVLERLAAALGVSYEHLVHGLQADAASNTPAHEALPTRKAMPRTLAFAIAGVIAVGTVVATRGVFRSRALELDANCMGFVIGVRDRDGNPTWIRSTESSLTLATESEWYGARVAIYGTATQVESGGRLVVRDFATGDSLWSAIPDGAMIHDWYRPEIAETGHFEPHSSCNEWPDCHNLCFVDIDGDARRDLVVRWQWVPWFPTLVTMYPGFGSNGEHDEPRYYATSGVVTFVKAVNIDDDPAMEVVCAATNNASVIQGVMLFVLDGDHWSGGTVDSLSELSHWAPNHGIKDGSLARVVFPQFDNEFMLGFDQIRLDPAELAIGRGANGELRFELGIGNNPLPWVTLTLDARLEPIGLVVNPDARARLNAASPGLGDRFDDAFVRQWLERRMRLGVADISIGNPGRRE